jgi:hypothetical protein
MAANGCRIGKIRVKGGGAEVRVLETHHAGNPEIISMLINLLDRARTGELVAFGMVSVNPRGTVGTAWCSDGGRHHHELASGALSLAHRMGGS